MDMGEINKTQLADEFKEYFKSILYLDDRNFFDGTHLKKTEEYTEYYKNKFMK